MSVQPRSDVELIEHLDWEHTPQCEHSQHREDRPTHEGDAYVLVRYSHDCGFVRDLYICRPFWAHIIEGGRFWCSGCMEDVSAHTTYTPLGWVE